MKFELLDNTGKFWSCSTHVNERVSKSVSIYYENMRWMNSKSLDILDAPSFCEYSLMVNNETGIDNCVENAIFMDTRKYIVMR